VPRELVTKLEPAEVFHEVLEHRWYMAERAQHDIPIEDAIDDYVRSILPGKPDEQSRCRSSRGSVTRSSVSRDRRRLRHRHVYAATACRAPRRPWCTATPSRMPINFDHGELVTLAQSMVEPTGQAKTFAAVSDS
jgi:hypothetical protein